MYFFKLPASSIHPDHLLPNTSQNKRPSVIAGGGSSNGSGGSNNTSKTEQSSHSRESGFLSATSLNADVSPASTLTGTYIHEARVAHDYFSRIRNMLTSPRRCEFSDPMENDPPPPQPTVNTNNPIRHNDVSSDSMVSLISGLSDSVISHSPCSI